MTQKLPTTTIKRCWKFAFPAFVGLLATTSSVLAQDDEDEDVFELSPFLVDGSGDQGYAATNTLAGTRLNSSLADVGASISVVTQDFIRDIGADDLETLLTYTGGTESVGLFGNRQGADVRENAGQVREERVNARQQQNTRIRGLAEADLTKDLFITDAPFDNYNIERVTISRGANAALFGLGSPGGILDATLKKANFSKDSMEIQMKFDNWGTERYQFDFNKILFKDRLAIRMAGLDEHKEWEQKGSYEDDVRFYTNVIFKATETTTIRASYTTGDIQAARPNSSPPGDYITSWVEAGKPLYDGFTGRYYTSIGAWQNNDPIPLAQSNDIWRGNSPYPNLFAGGEMTANGGRRLNVIFPDPSSPDPGGFNGSPQGMQVQLTNPGGNVDGWPGGGTTLWLVPQELRNVWRQPVGSFPSARGMSADEASFYSRPVITDRGTFDYREVLQALPNKQEDGNIKHFNVTLEQTYLDNDLGFELAFDDQEYSDNLVKFSRLNSLNVDMNLRLIDGTPNPNVGRAYIGGNAFAEPQRITRETMRATAFYRYDFAEKNEGSFLENFGRHVLTGSWSKQEVNFQQETHMAATTGNDWQLHTEGRPGQNIGGLNRALVISYVSGNLVDIANPSDFNIGGVNTIQRVPSVLNDVIYWDAARARDINFGDNSFANILSKTQAVSRGDQSFTFNAHTQNPAATWTWGGRGAYSEVDSLVGVLQSHFLDDHLVTTVSWRQDNVEITNYGTVKGDLNLDVGFADIPGTPTLDVSGKTTTSFSIVGHAPDFITDNLPGDMRISAHYNDSANFDASAFRTDIFGVEIPQQEGTTKDYGFTITAFNNRLAFKANFYEAEQIGASVNPIGRPNNVWRDIISWNTPEEIAAAGITSPPPGFLEAYEFALSGEVNEIITREIATDGAGNTLLDANGNPVILETLATVPAWTARNPQQNAIETAVGKTTSEGMELELIWSPTSNWRIAANVTRAEAIRSDIAAAEQVHLADRLPQWLNPNIGGRLYLNGNRQILTTDANGAIVGIAQNTENLVFNTADGTLNNNAQDFVNSLNGLLIFEGLPVPELREWRYNIVTNYQLDDKFGDFLSRFGVGGAIRWESKAFLGTGIKRDETGSLTQDASVIYEGDSNLRMDIWITYAQDIDRWGMTFRSRLGISDINSDDGLIATQANPDGTASAFRIEPPTTYTWTNTISF